MADFVIKQRILEKVHLFVIKPQLLQELHYKNEIFVLKIIIYLS